MQRIRNYLPIAAALAASSATLGCSSDAEPVASSLRTTELGATMAYRYYGEGIWLEQSSPHSVVAVSLSTHHWVADALRTLREAEAISVPACAGEGGGEDPMPMDWFQGARATPAGFEVDVLADPACDEAVPPLDPGNIDPSEQDLEMPVFNCEEQGAMSLACQYEELINPEIDPRNIYPVPGGKMPRLRLETEETCEGEFCEIITVGIEPIDPHPESEVVTVEVDCDLFPGICAYDITTLDPVGWISEDGETGDDGGEEEKEEDPECNSDVSREQGDCQTTNDDGSTTSCTTSYDGGSGEARMTTCVTKTKDCTSDGTCREVYRTEVIRHGDQESSELLDRWDSDSAFEEAYREDHDGEFPDSFWLDEYDPNSSTGCRKRWDKDLGGAVIECWTQE